MIKKYIMDLIFPNRRAVKLIYSLQKARNKGQKIKSVYLWNKLIKNYGLHISNGASIGEGLTLPHPLGIVIGMGVEIGKNSTIFQNVTIGTKHSSIDNEIKYPKIGNNVIIYTNTVVIGDVSIGDNTIIGANSLVLENLESNSIYAGNPIKKIGTN